MDSNNTLLITGATGQLGAFLLAELLGWGQSPAYSGAILCAKRPTSSFDQLEYVASFYGQPSKAYLNPQVHFVDLDLGFRTIVKRSNSLRYIPSFMRQPS